MRLVRLTSEADVGGAVALNRTKIVRIVRYPLFRLSYR